MNIENELKILPKDNINMQEFLNVLISKEYIIIKEPKLFLNQDIYYDTKDRILYNTDRSLRLRLKENKIFIIYKQPISSNTIYKQREEYQLSIFNNNIYEGIELLERKFSNIKLPSSLIEILQIKNNRNTVLIQAKDNTIIEIGFDNLLVNNKYKINNEIEFEIIEGNSDHLNYIYKIIDNLYNVSENNLSKYNRAIKELDL